MFQAYQSLVSHAPAQGAGQHGQRRPEAEFIGPLSRWAHDSKTAPRFIKYNLLPLSCGKERIWLDEAILTWLTEATKNNLWKRKVLYSLKFE